MPDQELLKTYLRKPITSVPDTTGRSANYARGHEEDVERILPRGHVSRVTLSGTAAINPRCTPKG